MRRQRASDPSADAPTSPETPGSDRVTPKRSSRRGHGSALLTHLPHWVPSVVCASPAMTALSLATLPWGPLPPFVFAYPVVVAVALMALAVVLALAPFVVVAHHTDGQALGNARMRVDLAGASPPAALRAREAELHARLKSVSQDLPQIPSVWLFDTRGRPIATD
jgi:hypothetical protein